MHWGLEHGVGHYIDLAGAIGGLSYFRLAICLERSPGRLHRNPAGQLMLLDFAQHRLDVDDRRAIDGVKTMGSSPTALHPRLT